MTRNPDILFITEYIKNVLYFAITRQGKVLTNTSDAHFFSIDSDLVYENYYSDFGPLNIGCVYKYCKLLNEKLNQFLNKQRIVHYTSFDPRKKSNAAYLLGCYGVLYLSLTPRDALKPLLIHGQSYRPFQDATQGESIYTISLMDCLCAIRKARQLGFFSFQDFDYEEYGRLDKIQGGDLNWIVPAKFLAFIGPVDYSVSLYHPPEMYIDYFKENNVKIVIRLNKRMYDGDVFNNVGITHYDLFFPDGSCPPRHILMKFLQIAEEASGAIAVHCKAGLGRTGSLIGCYLIKHYRMTAHEAIGWMRICRPGSVIGHQQGWLEQLEPWLLKQGNLYRKRMFQDTEKLPVHEFGVYSIAEKMAKRRPTVFNKPPSSPPPMQRQTRSDNTGRIQALKIKEDDAESDEEFIASNDLTIPTSTWAMKMKGCVLRTFYPTPVMNDSDHFPRQTHRTFWQKHFKCMSCDDCLWKLSVQCAKITPRKYDGSACCRCFDWAAPSKAGEAEQYDWRLRYSTQRENRGSPMAENTSGLSRRSSAAGEPRSRAPRTCDSPGINSSGRIARTKEIANDTTPIPTFCPSRGATIKTLADAKNFLIKSSIYNQQRERALNSSVLVTPFKSAGYHIEPNPVKTNAPYTASRGFSSTTQRRRHQLGRSPSPSPSPSPTRHIEHSRATNTMAMDKFFARDRSTVRESFSRLKVQGGRDGSIGAASVGAASLGACRDAPFARRPPSVRSDERPLATQGDMLNSIKFQRRFRDMVTTEMSPSSNDKSRIPGVSNVYPTRIGLAKDKPNTMADSRLDTRRNAPTKPSLGGQSMQFSPRARFPPHFVPHTADSKELSRSKEKNATSTSKFGQARPTSPKGRSRTTSFF